MVEIHFAFTMLLSLISNAIGADILAIISTASFSHQVSFRPLWKQLAANGHNVTLVTTDPLKEGDLKNIQQIDISYSYEYMNKHEVVDIAINESKSLYDSALAIRKVYKDTHTKLFESPEGVNLAHNKENHFDLLIIEAQIPDMMIYSWLFDIPFVGICSLDCALQFHDTAGNQVHPVVNPDPNFETKDRYLLSFRERIFSSVYMGIYRFLVKFVMFPKQHVIWRKYFGENVPLVDEIQSRMSMLFVGTNPVFHLVRALMPNTVTIGSGMHMTAPKPLTKDVKDFLDDASEGAIYFSLGSNIKGKHLNSSMKNTIINAFSKMPYKVLWKIDDTFEKLPPNILTSKWFSSQLEILRHSNVKLFITQGGLQSMQESIYANKPMIGIPYFGDQFGNVNRMVALEYGLKILKQNITEESIREAVTEIMTNPVYTANAQKYGEIFRDVDMSDTDKAVWWIEYVIRHKGARHFRNPLLDMPAWKRYMLDVLGVILFGFLVIIKVISFAFRTIKYLFKAGKPYGIEKKVA
ncbi:UDP-glycosyltransferase UGT5-like [Euwallacea fornicatus]|uniref:UDP-glycosyltransferase UGT5-like n=1 Tax=Euwallacea fornicatus TaxID=995702 RepID=UPI00338E2363